MNERLAEFLMWLVQNPERLEAFNGDDDTARASIVEAADLSPSEKEALLSDDSAAILTLLQASEENGLTWVGIPRIKIGDDEPRIKFTLGFAVFAAGGSGSMGATSRARSSQRGKKTSTSKGAAGRAVKRSSRSSAKASTSRTKSAGTASKSRPKAKRRR
ncbi:MAG TPA: hypothetical protein VM791_09215 [Vicinamibacterales bacterium]|jgi:hypothetical protein|nr:hypothetical protein [Vicinamibacterales bacterium]